MARPVYLPSVEGQELVVSESESTETLTNLRNVRMKILFINRTTFLEVGDASSFT